MSRPVNAQLHFVLHTSHTIVTAIPSLTWRRDENVDSFPNPRLLGLLLLPSDKNSGDDPRKRAAQGLELLKALG